MAKYYVRDGMEKAVLEADSPLDGCCKAVLHFFNTFAVNGFYIVSELIAEKKRKKDEDNP